MELDDLYQELILDHYKNPRHAAKIPEERVLVDEQNPTCGDHIRMTAAVQGDKLEDVSIECSGCAICTASASMMSERVVGQSLTEIRAFTSRFQAMMRGGEEISDDDLGDLAALKGVRKFPMRVKCATMPWHALEASIQRLDEKRG